MKRNHDAPHLNEPSIHELPRNTTELNGSKRRWPRKLAKSASPAPAAKEMGDNEDLIEDDYDSYDELFTQHFTNEKLSQLDGTEVVPASQDKPPISSQAKSARSLQKPTNNSKRFILQSKISQEPDLQNERKEGLPWAQRYAPQTLEELAVHKKKVSDVEQWLNNALTGKSRKNLLVLKGPAGSGKTTTISLLSGKLKFNILEWKSPSGSEYGGKDYVSLAAQFDGFLSRGHKFPSLDLDDSGDSQPPMEDNHLQRRIILIEEFPTLSGSTASVLAAFRLSIMRYISSVDAPHVQTDYDIGETETPPIVIIVSETFSDPESSFENLTVHRLLGREISKHSSTSVIEFNSIAPTFMFKALNLVLKKSACQPMGNQTSTQSIIKSISMVGDIRNAIASLEFLCLGGSDRCSGGFHTTKIRNIIRNHKNIAPTSSETQGLSQREASLGLFHAVGKIIYNKRTCGNDTENQQDIDLPGVSRVHVNELLNETGTDIQSFIDTLHENYVPSCNGPSFTRCLDDCIGSLSDSDVLCVDRKGLSRSRAGLGSNFVKPGSGIDLLRQEEISYQVTARGLLCALPHPVKRQISHAGSTSHLRDPNKLLFPPAIRLACQFEETRDLINSWENALLGSTVRPSAVPLLGHTGSKSRKPTREGKGPGQSNDSGNSKSVAILTARNDLILHQLPYMVMILGKGTESRSLQRLTALKTRGFNDSLQQDEPYTWDSSLQGCNASDFRKLGRENRNTQLERQAVFQADDEQLFLSDDDIVDDL